MALGIKTTMVEHMTEKEFQSWLVDLAHLYKWKTMHILRPKGTEAGWPDLVLIKAPRLIFAELKTMKGKATAAQTWWGNALVEVAAANSTIEYHLWRPSDRDEIERVVKS